MLRLAALPEAQRAIVESVYTWMRVGDLSVDVSFLLDPLSAVMILVVTGVGFLIHVYSTGYMAHEPDVRRFFLYLNLFMFAMLTLVLADNFLLMFVGWEGVGLCSYLLIGFWYERPAAAAAGKKAFIVNRIGDFGFLLGMFMLFTVTGTLQYQRMFAVAPHLFLAGGAVITVATLLLFLGATGKSAQLPALRLAAGRDGGPDPGLRAHPRRHHGDGRRLHGGPHARAVPARARLARGRGLGRRRHRAVRRDHRARAERHQARARLLDRQPARLHVHGLRRGRVHGRHLPPDDARLLQGAAVPRRGLGDPRACRASRTCAAWAASRARLPWTHGAMLVATLAIAGIPPFAGFFSKDEILASAFASGHTAIWVMGLAGAVLTAFYMFRLYLLTFRGPSRLTHEAGHHLHESPPAMIVPLFVLAVLSVVGGLVGPPLQEGGHPFARWLAPVFASALMRASHAAAHEVPVATEWMLIGLSVLVAAAGIAFAFRAYLWSPQTATRLRERLAGVHRALLNKYWVDELYDSTVVRPVYHTARAFWRFWDTKVLDGIVNGVGVTLEGVSAVLRLFQTGFVGTYALSLHAGRGRPAPPIFLRPLARELPLALLLIFLPLAGAVLSLATPAAAARWHRRWATTRGAGRVRAVAAAVGGRYPPGRPG